MTSDTYMVYWKPFKVRYAEFMKVFNETGMLIDYMLKNHIRFDDRYTNWN
jgi:hypothetical protein